MVMRLIPIVFATVHVLLWMQAFGVTGLAGDEAPKTRVHAKSGRVSLAFEPVQTIVEPVSMAGKKPEGMKAHLRDLQDGAKLYLVLKGIRTDRPPGVIYGVYIDLPPKPTAEDKRKHLAGYLNFFNFVVESAAEKNPTRRDSMSFQITKLAVDLQKRGLLKDKPVITFIPTGMPDTAAKPVVGEVSIVELALPSRK
jgi:hypothetical protein